MYTNLKERMGDLFDPEVSSASQWLQDAATKLGASYVKLESVRVEGRYRWATTAIINGVTFRGRGATPEEAVQDLAAKIQGTQQA